MTSHVDTRFYRFTPATAEWRRVAAELRDVPVTGLAALDGMFYAVDEFSSLPVCCRGCRRPPWARAVLAIVHRDGLRVIRSYALSLWDSARRPFDS